VGFPCIDQAVQVSILVAIVDAVIVGDRDGISSRRELMVGSMGSHDH